MGDEECDFDTFMEEIDKENPLVTNTNENDDINKANDDGDADDNDDDLLMFAAQEIESHSQTSAIISKSDSPSVASTADVNSSIQSQMMEEMRKMQEKIMMLENQLKAQKQPTVRPKIQPKPKIQPTNQSAITDRKPSEIKATPIASQDSNSQPAGKLSFADAIKAAATNSDNDNKAADAKQKLSKNEERELFGDFEDEDDWQDLDGERVSQLSESGREMQRLLCDEKVRSAQQPQHHEMHNTTRPTPTTSTKPIALLEKASKTYITNLIGIPNHPEITSSYTGDHCSVLRTSGIDDKSVVKEQYSGIRIANPLVSNEQLKVLMDDRRMIKMSSLRQKLGSRDLDGDWVTMGVLVSKSEQKVSAKGQAYCIWKLSDLTDCDKAPISMFLFRDVNTRHCKTMLGSVLGFLNPSVMANKDDYKSKNNSDDISLTVDNAKKVLPLGISRDLGTCKGKTKIGNACTNFINVSQGDYCSYHVQSAYKKQSAKRADLQNGFSGVVPKFRKDLEKIRNNGNNIVSYKNDVFTSNRPVSKNTSKVSLQSLISHQTSQKEISCRGYNDSLKKRNEINTLLLHDLLTPSDKVAEAPGQGSKDGKEQIFHDLLMKPTVGSMNFVKYLKDINGIPSVTSKKAEKEPEMTAELLFRDHKKKVVSDSSPLAPKLGRGMDKNGFINLDSPPPSIRNTKQVLANERAKLEAIQKIKEMGGLKKNDPNSTTVNRHDKAYQERIKKRLRESDDKDSKTSPPNKKSKLLGNVVDLNSPEIQKLINAKSAHENLLSAAQEAKQDQYFDALEKTEAMEEKMINTKEIKVTAVHCPTCQYTDLSISSLCVSQGHRTKKVKATKRFFRCKDCKFKTYSLDRMPSIACTNCGGKSFERTGMMTERKGPLLESEKLLLRGEERPNVFS